MANLSDLTAGRILPNPAKMISSARMKDIGALAAETTARLPKS